MSGMYALTHMPCSRNEGSVYLKVRYSSAVYGKYRYIVILSRSVLRTCYHISYRKKNDSVLTSKHLYFASILIISTTIFNYKHFFRVL